uniref:Uncharacterized protein n=1 Tax=Daphnia galeata TaxID=27404 RepID=A0A8J2R8A8_9CRUS|nr:unnamed protein product [Daphnia galeata]
MIHLTHWVCYYGMEDCSDGSEKLYFNAPPGVNSAYTQAMTTGVPAGAYPSSIQTNDVYSNSSSNSGYQGASSQTAYGS